MVFLTPKKILDVKNGRFRSQISLHIRHFFTFDFFHFISWLRKPALTHTEPIFHHVFLPKYFYERSELLIDGDGKKSTPKKYEKKRASYAKKRAPSPSSLETLPATDSELRPRRSSWVRLAYTDPSGDRP